jgi:hypothetical protein
MHHDKVGKCVAKPSPSSYTSGGCGGTFEEQLELRSGSALRVARIGSGAVDGGSWQRLQLSPAMDLRQTGVYPTNPDKEKHPGPKTGVLPTLDPSVKDVPLHHIVELRGFEPLTSSMRTKRSTN